MTNDFEQNDNTRTHVALTKGTMVAHYRIVEKIGAGGMGEVYLAEDTKLDREVALKFLPSHLCQDEDCRARFTREARAVAKLNHPNIITVFEVSEYQERPFFAMEHVEGRALKDVIKKDALPISEIVELAIGICEGLNKAHQSGIIHRDIKPSSIVIDVDGRPKLLDFGLAAIQGSEKLTISGSTLGTIGYMSPEQAEGKEVDHRSDIFSLGVILYEMITSHRPFERDNEVATIQAIVSTTPEPMARYKLNVPDDLQRIVTKLMAKDPASRYQHIDEVPVDLRAVDLKASTVSQIDVAPLSEPAAVRSAFWRSVLPWAMAVLLALVAIWSLTRTPSELQKPVAHVVVSRSQSAPLAPDAGGPQLAVSPDGKRLVYLSKVGSTYPLALREIDQLEARVLPGTEGDGSPFFSPDGQWIGFSGGGELKKLFLDGGKPVSLCEAKLGMGGSWGIDDTIFFTPVWNGGIWKISANGGEPIQVTTPAEGEFGHWSALALPGGKAVLFSILNTSVTDSDVAVLSRETGELRIIVKGATDARYSPTGHILYAQSGTMVAAPFDLDRLEIGEPRLPVLADVMQSTGSGHAQMGFSEDGLLYYIRGGGVDCSSSNCMG